MVRNLHLEWDESDYNNACGCTLLRTKNSLVTQKLKETLSPVMSVKQSRKIELILWHFYEFEFEFLHLSVRSWGTSKLVQNVWGLLKFCVFESYRKALVRNSGSRCVENVIRNSVYFLATPLHFPWLLRGRVVQVIKNTNEGKQANFGKRVPQPSGKNFQSVKYMSSR